MRHGRTRLRARLVIAAGLVITAGLAAAWTLGAPPPFLLGGIQVNEPDHAEWMDGLAARGFNTVSVTVYAKQGNWDTDHLWWEDEEPAVLSEIRAAKAAGIHVVLILRVALDHAFEHNRFLWHGMIMPTSDAQLDSWFRQYTEFVRTWATIAAAEGVDVLGIASEMSALTNTLPIDELPALEEYYLDEDKQTERKEELLAYDSLAEQHLQATGDDTAYDSPAAYFEDESAANRSWARRTSFADEPDLDRRLAAINGRRQRLEAHWRALAAETRRHFPGPLTYAANFDQYHTVTFWDAFDRIGINAYFPLRENWRPIDDVDALYPELLAGWRGILDDIDRFRQAHDIGHLPVILTEIGLTSRRNSTLRPWAGSGFTLVPEGDGETTRLLAFQDEPEEPRERALALTALSVAADERPGLLGGLLYWKLSTKNYHKPHEPFAIIIAPVADDPATVGPDSEQTAADDPALAALRRFVERPPLERLARGRDAALAALARQMDGE